MVRGNVNKIDEYWAKKKTKSDVDELKAWWFSHGRSWNIEETESFDEFKTELYIFRLETENDIMRRTISFLYEQLKAKRNKD